MFAFRVSVKMFVQLERLDFAEGPSLDSSAPRKLVLSDLRCAYFFVSLNNYCCHIVSLVDFFIPSF